MLGTKKKLIKNLNNIFEAYRIDKRDFCISLGVDYVTIYRWLNRSRTISFDYLDKIALKLNMKVCDLVNPKLKIRIKANIFIPSKNVKITVR